ncbi:DNA-binding protein [Halorhabdus sp. CBA1104]|uniref:helix-turn-helix domain-containing protein n=1 Tax=unclassified Halorhabdus TaxID=2621901 RepID=UPI0012B2F681|nr:MULTISPECIES: helix-turn-helix domain-containing protein [unclassified Halorhabdus]QGN07695.1 DNA-binding protein [Halorhabdus sp. CBA1104]
MSLVCEFELLSSTLPLTAVASDLETVLHVDDVISGTKAVPALVFSVTGVDPDRLEERLDERALIREYVALESAYVESRYRVRLDEDPTGVYTQLVDLRTHPIGAVVTGRGWKVSARFADRSDLDAFRNACGGSDVEFRPLRLFETEADPADDYGLTRPQHEALLVAARMGYFDVPRNATLSDLADELDSTTSALSERLRRGQRQLVERTIAGSA